MTHSSWKTFFSIIIGILILGWIGLWLLRRYSTLQHQKVFQQFPCHSYFLYKSWSRGYLHPVLYERIVSFTPNALHYMAQQKWVVAMLMRNHGQHIIPLWRHYWEPLLSHCKDYRIVIVENDSLDHTRSLLLQWASENHRVHILCGGNESQPINQPSCKLHVFTSPYSNLGSHEKDTSSSRIQLMASFRNMYLNYIYHNFADFDMLMVCDPDLIGQRYTPGFYHSVWYLSTHTSLWGIGSYTLTPDNRPFDPFSFIVKGGSLYWWSHDHKKQHDIQVTKDSAKQVNRAIEPFPVVSTFHGCCLYRLSALRSIFPIYLYLDQGYVCEHTTFHHQFPPNSLYLNPYWICLLSKNLY